MSNKKKRKRPAGGASPYRAPAPASAPRRGLLDSIFTPRPPGGSPMPRLRRTLARGFVTAVSIPWLVVAVPVTILVVWIALVLRGFEGPFTVLNVTFAIPPVSTFADTQLVGKTFRASVDAAGPSSAVIGLVGFGIVLVFHAVVDAVVSSLSVERLRTGATSAWALRRALHVLPVTAGIGFISLGLLIAGNVLAALLGGPGVIFGLLGAMTAGVYLFGFAPAIAADEERGFAETLIRSVRAARMPGSANLWLAALYVVASLLTLVTPLPGAEIGVNPTALAWAVTIVVNLFHVGIQATLAYRYLAVASDVPEGPPARQAAARR